MAHQAVPVREVGGPLRLRAELVRTLSTLEAEVQRALGHAVLSPEDIHDLHRDLRRLASGMVVWSQLVPASHGGETEQTGRRLRRLARLVGRVRDRDVTMELLAPPERRTSPPGERSPWPAFVSRLRDDTHTGRELLRAFLNSEQQAGLFERARRLLEQTPRTGAAEGLHRILAEERRLRQGRVRKAHQKACRRPTSQRLHRLRIRIRQWRHLATLELVARSVRNVPPPASWQRLQARLGRLHDLDVALATIPAEMADLLPAQRLKETRRELRRSVSKSLERMAARPAELTAQARRRAPAP